MEGTWACLIPFILVIPISIITKQVQSVCRFTGRKLSFTSELAWRD